MSKAAPKLKVAKAGAASRPGVGTPVVATEEQEMAVLAEYLDHIGVLWCHPVNEGRRSYYLGKKLKAQGLKSGVPDVLIFENWHDRKFTYGHGIAIELKSERKGAKLSPAQTNWLQSLASRGWQTTTAKGSRPAIDFVQRWLWRGL